MEIGKAMLRPGPSCNGQPVTASHHLDSGMRTQPTWSAHTCDVGIKGHGRPTLAPDHSSREHYRPMV